MGPPSEQQGSSGQLRVVTTYTLCYFLVEQAQALAQWDLVAQPGLKMEPPPESSSQLSSEIQESYSKDREKSKPSPGREDGPGKGWRGKLLLHFPELSPAPESAPAQSWPLGSQVSGSVICWAVLGQRQVSSRKVVLYEKQHETFGSPSWS